ncbi:MAG: GNAT family N-acetyltransferase [Nannocystaceae bacterium]|nr:GNAT family N-acetyltransferase [Nannocystaceae bacterium]
MSDAMVTLVCGPTGAGKTTWAIEHAARCGGLRFSIDEWMAELFAADRGEPQLAWMLERIARCETVIWSLCTQALGRGVDVVLDLGFSQREHRDKFGALAKVAGVETVTHWVDADVEQRRARVVQRNAQGGDTFAIDVTPAMFEMMEARFEPPAGPEREACTKVTTRNESSFTLRAEAPGDAAQVGDVLQRTFGAPGEAEVVARLRGSEDDGVRLVAMVGDGGNGQRVVGHVQMSRVRIGEHCGVGLRPVAVDPEHQGRGLGQTLVTEALARSAGRSEPFAVVLGSPAYYGRFGFAHDPAITSVYGGPPGAFQVLALQPGGLEGVAGQAAYSDAFSVV